MYPGIYGNGHVIPGDRIHRNLSRVLLDLYNQKKMNRKKLVAGDQEADHHQKASYYNGRDRKWYLSFQKKANT